MPIRKESNLTAKSEIRRIARAVRDACRKIAKLDNDAYAPLRWDERLPGCCAIASDALARMLVHRGFDARVVCGGFRKRKNSVYVNGHCWVLSCGFIVDVTASQFYGERGPIFVLPRHDVRWMRYESTNLSVDEWDEPQRPTPFLRALIFAQPSMARLKLARKPQSRILAT